MNTPLEFPDTNSQPPIPTMNETFDFERSLLDVNRPISIAGSSIDDQSTVASPSRVPDLPFSAIHSGRTNPAQSGAQVSSSAGLGRSAYQEGLEGFDK
jgi:hypothetical protein